MLPYIFTENAMADVVKYAMSYDDKEEGLGIRFLNEVEVTALEISKMPKAFVSSYKTQESVKQNIFSIN